MAVTGPALSLLELDAVLVNAENREGDWEVVLRRTLADDFTLRRSKGAKPDENVDAFLDAVAGDTRRRTRLAGRRVETVARTRRCRHTAKPSLR
jgi:hypothetical protein